jgi:hypothetical protein
MKLNEWRAVQATELATPGQLGRIMRECHRLGYRDRCDRAARLAALAAVLGLGRIGSTRELTMGQAGQLIRILTSCSGRAEFETRLRRRSDAAPRRSAQHPDLVPLLVRRMLAASLSARCAAGYEHGDTDAAAEQVSAQVGPAAAGRGHLQ